MGTGVGETLVQTYTPVDTRYGTVVDPTPSDEIAVHHTRVSHSSIQVFAVARADISGDFGVVSSSASQLFAADRELVSYVMCEKPYE